MRGYLAAVLICATFLIRVQGFAPSVSRKHPAVAIGSAGLSYHKSGRPSWSSALNASGKDEKVESFHDCSSRSRRQLLSTLATVVTAGAIASYTSEPADAAADSTEATIWLTGKTPIVPGQKPKDKNDTKGTRKDPNFLRSISDCKSQCERGASGLAKSKEDCLSECQDICCTTYEQCTFPIVPRI